MNSQQQNKTLILTSILAFALLANVNVGAIYATGNMDDEEEEEAIYELQDAIEEIKGTLGTIELNLSSGTNDIQANCPSTEEIVQEVVENITTQQQPEPEEEQPTSSCPIVEQPAPQQNQSVLPPFVIAEPATEQNETQTGCNPIPEEPAAIVEENETSSDLVPIICPINGELLGYTNTTSGEQLPISAGGGNNTGLLPPIVIPPEETVVAPEVVEQEQPIQECNNATAQQPTQEESQSIVPTEEESPIEFATNCGCFVVDKSPEEVEGNGGGGESVEQGLSN